MTIEMKKQLRIRALSTLGAVAAASLLLALPLQANYTSTILNSNPVAYFPLDEGPGATTVSSAVSGLSGDVFGSPTRVAGPRGNGTTAFMFNNPFGDEDPGGQFSPPVSDYIRVPHNAVLNITGSVSLELWLNRPTGPRVGWEGFAGKNDNAYQLRRNSIASTVGHNRIAWSVNYQDGNRLPDDNVTVFGGSPVSSADINFDNWMHIVGVLDFDAEKQLIYIDGMLDAEVDLPADRTSVNENTFDFMIGAHLSSSEVVQRGTVGAIAEVAVYDYALTAAQIQGHYLAIPEPSVYALFGGLAGLALVLLRRRKS